MPIGFNTTQHDYTYTFVTWGFRSVNAAFSMGFLNCTDRKMRYSWTYKNCVSRLIQHYHILTVPFIYFDKIVRKATSIHNIFRDNIKFCKKIKVIISCAFKAVSSNSFILRIRKLFSFIIREDPHHPHIRVSIHTFYILLLSLICSK